MEEDKWRKFQSTVRDERELCEKASPAPRGPRGNRRATCPKYPLGPRRPRASPARVGEMLPKFPNPILFGAETHELSFQTKSELLFQTKSEPLFQTKPEPSFQTKSELRFQTDSEPVSEYENQSHFCIFLYQSVKAHGQDRQRVKKL